MARFWSLSAPDQLTPISSLQVIIVVVIAFQVLEWQLTVLGVHEQVAIFVFEDLAHVLLRNQLVIQALDHGGGLGVRHWIATLDSIENDLKVLRHLSDLLVCRSQLTVLNLVSFLFNLA